MRRRLRHTLIWLLVAAVGTAVIGHWLEELSIEYSPSSVPENARARPVFVLDDVNWTTFRMPSTGRHFKILSRANLVGSVESLADQDFPYQVDYRIESLTGSLIAKGSFALQAKFIPKIDPLGAPSRDAFYSNLDLTPATAKTSTLELPGDEVLVIRLRAAPVTGPVRDISVRAFLRSVVSERKLSYQWSRLSTTSRAQLVRPRLHAFADLTPSESRGILSNRWSPLGAQGVAGDDFQERTLYLRDDLVPARRQLVEPLGIGEIRCGPGRRAILGMPAPGGMLRLEFRRTESGQLSAARARIRFFGETIQKRSLYEHFLDGEMSEFTGSFDAGMLEIESPVDVAIRPFVNFGDGAEHPLEREPILVRAWSCAAEEAVTFQIAPDRSETDFFRVSVRSVVDAATTLRTEFLSIENAVLHAAEHEISCVPSEYDVMLTPEGEVVVQDPIEVISELPAAVTSIRLSADAPVFVNAYTRPASLLHRTRVPADYNRALPDPDRLPLWFGLRPEGATDLIRAHRSVLISIQTRPPEDDADILVGKYQWEDYQPVEGALGQYLLNERDPTSPSRDEALPSLFMPLKAGEEQLLTLANPPGLELPSRRLAFVRSGRDPVLLSIVIDNIPFFERELVTDRGELLLPPIPPQSRTMRVECAANDLQCFLNYVQPDKATKLKRLAQRIAPGDSLAYFCSKSGDEDELLTGTYFAPPENALEAEMRVAIRPGAGGGFRSEAETLTLRERVYLLAPEKAMRTPVLGGKIAEVDGGRRFFIPLGRDLRPGEYRVEITMRKGCGGYLTVSKVTGGDYSDIRFFREASR